MLQILGKNRDTICGASLLMVKGNKLYQPFQDFIIIEFYLLCGYILNLLNI
jgi:hypothetical protein